MRWSRRSAAAAGDAGTDTTAGTGTGDDVDTTDEQKDPRAEGPWDVTERPRVDEDDDETPRLDLGSLVLLGHPEVQVQLQVDEESGQVAAALLIAEDGAMELRAFAAPRNEDIWADVREQMSAEAKRRGGDTREVEGPYGTVLQMVVPVVTPDGEQGTQQSAVLGIGGPRWLLRAVMYGRPAREWRPTGLLESLLREVVVDRGTQPMTPGESLPLRLPPGAQRLDQGPLTTA
jgi:hypothetical protein